MFWGWIFHNILEINELNKKWWKYGWLEKLIEQVPILAGLKIRRTALFCYFIVYDEKKEKNGNGRLYRVRVSEKCCGQRKNVGGDWPGGLSYNHRAG